MGAFNFSSRIMSWNSEFIILIILLHDTHDIQSTRIHLDFTVRRITFAVTYVGRYGILLNVCDLLRRSHEVADMTMLALVTGREQSGRYVVQGQRSGSSAELTRSRSAYL